jgi:hypothetical protein
MDHNRALVGTPKASAHSNISSTDVVKTTLPADMTFRAVEGEARRGVLSRLGQERC